MQSKRPSERTRSGTTNSTALFQQERLRKINSKGLRQFVWKNDKKRLQNQRSTLCEASRDARSTNVLATEGIPPPPPPGASLTISLLLRRGATINGGQATHETTGLTSRAMIQQLTKRDYKKRKKKKKKQGHLAHGVFEGTRGSNHDPCITDVNESLLEPELVAPRGDGGTDHQLDGACHLLRECVGLTRAPQRPTGATNTQT